MSFLHGLSAIQNLHPLFVHFPIALILVTFLFEALWLFTKTEQFRQFATWLLYLSALSAIVAVASGLAASNSLGHDSPGHEFVHQHRDVMYWMTGFLLVTSAGVLSMKNIRNGNLRKFLIIPLLVVSALLVYGADKGGFLVFQHGMGVNMPVMHEAQPHDSHTETDHQHETPVKEKQSNKHQHDDHDHQH